MDPHSLAYSAEQHYEPNHNYNHDANTQRFQESQLTNEVKKTDFEYPRTEKEKENEREKER